jgi:Zn-dependent protease/CBS domain-containing protein
VNLRTIVKSIPGRGGFLRVRIKIHYTWLFAFVLATFNLVTQLTQTFSLWLQIGLGISTVLVFLVMMVVRQLAIDFLAVSRGIPLRKVSISILGGVPGIPRAYTSPLVELLLGVSGFLFSILLVILFYFIYLYFVTANLELAGGLVLWLIAFIIIFAAFNIIPGFPLDGGRVLRALLWRSNNDYDCSTRIAARIGQAAGIILIAVGGWITYLGRPWFEDGVVIIVGWIILVNATQSMRTSNLRRYLAGTRMSEVMIFKDIPEVASHLTVRQLVREYVLARGHYFFVVADSDGMKGFVTLQRIRKIPRKRWESLTVGSIARPITGIFHTTFDQLAADVLEQMIEMDIDQMPVIKEGRVIGIVERDELLRLSLLRRNLKYLSSKI